MHLTRRAFAVSATGLALAGTSALAQKKTPLLISYTATAEFGAVFVAKEHGFFDKHGLDAKLQLIPVSPNVASAVMSGSVQIGGTTPPVLLQAVDSGLDLVAVAGGGVYENSSHGVGIVARTGVAMTGPQDLVGKKFGVPGFGATLHLLVKKWLMDKGIDPKRVTFVELPIPQMPDVLKGGSVDAVVTAEPFIARMVQSGIGTRVSAFDNELPSGFASVLYISTREWATNNAPAVAAFRSAIAEAVVYANSNREAAYVDIGKYFTVPPPVLRATPWPNWVPVLTDQHLRFWSDTMREQALLKKQPMLSSTILR